MKTHTYSQEMKMTLFMINRDRLRAASETSIITEYIQRRDVNAVNILIC